MADVEVFQDGVKWVWSNFCSAGYSSRMSYEELSAEQRPAHLVFWYESEVQNGGHLQYFENRGIEHLAETIAALGLVSASCQQRLLQDASTLFLSNPRKPTSEG
jgi:hypothetical protein